MIGFRLKLAEHLVKSFTDLDQLSLNNYHHVGNDLEFDTFMSNLMLQMYSPSDHYPWESPVASMMTRLIHSFIHHVVCHVVSCECSDVTGYLTAVTAAVNSLSDTLNTRPSWKPIQYALYIRVKEYFGTERDKECDSKWQSIQRMFGEKACGQVFMHKACIGEGMIGEGHALPSYEGEGMEGMRGLLNTFAMRTILPFLKNYSSSFEVHF